MHAYHMRLARSDISHSALFIWAFYPETTGRRLEEMDALFTDAPIFVPGTKYAKVEDYRAAERELREGMFFGPLPRSQLNVCICRNLCAWSPHRGGRKYPRRRRREVLWYG